MAGGSRASRPVVATVCVAAGLTVLALVGAVLLRLDAAAPVSSAAASTRAPTATSAGQLNCDSGPCELLATRSVGGNTVDLLANSAATIGRVRITTSQGLESVFETTITRLGASLTTQSLTCVDGQIPACMVSGPSPDGRAGEVFVDTAEGWSRTDAPYFSSAGYLGLSGSTTVPEVLTAQTNCDSDLSSQCGQSPVYVQVFAVVGQSIGCSKTVSRLDRLPGWPTVSIPQSDLHPC